MYDYIMIVGITIIVVLIALFVPMLAYTLYNTIKS